MKNASTILSALALIGVIVLFGLHFGGNTTGKQKAVTANGKEVISPAAKIAYIDLDTFEANYTLLKVKNAEFKKRKEKDDAELQRSADQLKNDYQELVRKAATMSQAEGQAAEKRLTQMKSSLDNRSATMEDEYRKDQMAFQDTMRKELDAFLEEYNNQHHFDYIFSYQHANPQIMYAEKSLNITDDVLQAMNARPRAAAATAKGK